MSEQKGEEQFTPSAMTDHIRDFLESDPEYREIVEAFIGRPGGIFLFNPMKDDLIFKWFTVDAEELVLLVKAAIIQLLGAWTGGDKVANYAKEHLIVKIAESNEIKMHDWDASYEGVPVAVNCQVIGAANEETYTKKAMVACLACHESQTVRNLGKLPRCSNKDCENYRTEMQLVRASLKTGPIKTIMIQEPLEESKHGSPKFFQCIIKDDDVKKTFGGQRKKIIGVLRSEPQKYKTTNRIVINAISVHDLEDVEIIYPDDEQKKIFIEMSKKDNYIAKLQDSFSPEVRYGGTELAKLCLILSIIGGISQGRIRGFVHSLLIGDPGTAKSKMLQFILLVTQKSGLAVGGTASGAGITVSMDTLPNRIKMPRAGLIPNCSGGDAVIDEMNQLEEEDLGKTFEAMEDGKIHYNKGGFDIVLIAETAIHGGANPRGFYYDKRKTIVDNINMPGPLISRFDLKINLYDSDSMVENSRIIDHMTLIRDPTPEGKPGLEDYIEKNKLLSPKELLLLFNFAKTFNPVFTPEASKQVKEFYLVMKQIEQPEGSLRIDKRFPEAISRVSQAFARLHFSNTVTKEHVMTVIEIYKKTLATFGMNVERGEMQLPLEAGYKLREAAFRFAFREQQKAQGITFLHEDTVLNSMCKHYHSHWPTPDQAAVYFGYMAKTDKLEKREGRYNLIG